MPVHTTSRASSIYFLNFEKAQATASHYGKSTLNVTLWNFYKVCTKKSKHSGMHQLPSPVARMTTGVNESQRWHKAFWLVCKSLLYSPLFYKLKSTCANPYCIAKCIYCVPTTKRYSAAGYTKVTVRAGKGGKQMIQACLHLSAIPTDIKDSQFKSEHSPVLSQ